jgi:hypothetical protein
MTLSIHSTGNQRSNCDPIVAMFLHRFGQLSVFFWCPRNRLHSVVGRIQGFGPLLITLSNRSTGNHRSSCDPIVAMFLYRFGELSVFFWCPSTRLLTLVGRIQSVGPSFITLMTRSTRNHRSSCDPIVAMHFHRLGQLNVFFWLSLKRLLPVVGKM